MAQHFENVVLTDYIDTGLLKLLDRDLATLTVMSGESDPTSTPNDALIDNATQGALKINGDIIIDYKNKLLNSTALANQLQPLSSLLTDFSESELEPPCLINTDGEVLGVTNYGASAIINTSVDGAKGLAKRNIIRSAQISDASVIQGKLESPLVEDPPFKCGDILYSCSTANRNGFLKLGIGYTVGSSTSNATYRNNIYFNLYAKLWAAPDVVLRDYSNLIVSKGSSAEEDFGGNKSIELPNPKPNVTNVLLETTDPGIYEVIMQYPGFYELFAVSGGGGSASFGRGSGGTTEASYPAIGGS